MELKDSLEILNVLDTSDLASEFLALCFKAAMGEMGSKEKLRFEEIAFNNFSKDAAKGLIMFAFEVSEASENVVRRLGVFKDYFSECYQEVETIGDSENKELH